MGDSWRWFARWGVLAIIVALGALGAAPARAGVVALDAAAGSFTLDGRGESWLDPTGRAEVSTVATGDAAAWTPTRAGQVVPLRSGQALWLRFTLSKADDDERWYLEIPHPAIDRLTLYTRDAQDRWVTQAAGDLLPVARWPLPHRHALLPLVLRPGTEQVFWLRVENPQGFAAPLEFTSERELVRREQRSGLVLGIYFGLAGLSIVLGVLAAGWLRDPAFGWYALTVSLMALAQASLTGVAGLHLWPHWAWWNDVAAVTLAPAAAAALLGFVSTVVALPERSRRTHRLLAALAGACLLASAVLLLAEPAWRPRVLLPVLVIAIVASVAVVVWAASRGDRHAGWLLVGMAPVAIAAAFPLARVAGLLPVTFWTLHATQVGIAIELPLLMAVLLARSQDRRENVRRIHGLQRIDPATGLINAQVFHERLQRLIARSGRLKHESVVLLVEIANLDVLQRDFDRRWAEELPLLVADRLLSTAREIDSVARLSDHRFGMLVEGPLTPDEAAATGSKVVARCLMPFRDRPVEWVAQVRVAQAMVPNGLEAGALMERLEGVLAAVPADSKRAVFPLRTATA